VRDQLPSWQEDASIPGKPCVSLRYPSRSAGTWEISRPMIACTEKRLSGVIEMAPSPAQHPSDSRI